MRCRVSRTPPEAAPDLDQHDQHSHSANDEIAPNSNIVRNPTEEQRADAHVAVHRGVSNEGKLPAYEPPGKRRPTGDKQSEKPQAVALPNEHSREQCPK